MMDTEEKYKVVIIDDERSASDALRRELEPYREFEIKGIASSGAKGKKMIMELHPDLLFLDVELPDILGLNLLSEIKDDVLWDMKVVFYCCSGASLFCFFYYSSDAATGNVYD